MQKYHCCDVNIIISHYVKDWAKEIVESYLTQIKDAQFICLSKVKFSFMITFSNKIKDLGHGIVAAVNETKDYLQTRPLKTVPTKVLEEAIFKKYYEEKILSLDDFDPLENYLQLLKLKREFLFQELKDDAALEKFENELIKTSKDIATEAFDKFKRRLNNFREASVCTKDEMKEWDVKIREIKNKFGIFNDRDKEDITIASEYLAYIQNKNNELQFSTNDRGFKESLNLFKVKMSLKFPDVIFLKQTGGKV